MSSIDLVIPPSEHSSPVASPWELVDLRSLLTQRMDRVDVVPGKIYTRLGVHWYGAGPFKKDAADGKEIKGHFLNVVRHQDFIYNRLFAWKGAFGIVSEEMAGCYVSGEFPVFSIDTTRLVPDFLRMWLTLPFMWRVVGNKSSGSTATSRRRLKEEDLLSLSIPLPSVAEQNGIVRAVSAVEADKVESEKLVQTVRRLRLSLVTYLFNFGPTRLSETPIVETLNTDVGLMPSHWKIARMSDLVEVKQGQIDPTVDPYRNMPNVGAENIESGTGRLLRVRPAKDVGVVSGKYLFTNEDVLYSKIRPYLKKAALPDQTGICSSDIYPLRPIHGKLVREFLYHILLTDQFTSQAVSFQGGFLPRINRTQLGLINNPVPPIEEQERIARILSSIDSLILVEERSKMAVSDLLTSILHELFLVRIRVPTEDLV